MSKFEVPYDIIGAAEVDITVIGGEHAGLANVAGIADAIKSARWHCDVTYLVDNGKRVAAVVAVERE